ncbi:hypothetical protein [Dyella nitratireducens]|uniref:Vegetative cell wall protein gp1 n=1 Tax=Dyella nitratireducens TaxID=1849580 RepID=A0ABQ1FZJ1_9GAMM|nr:hypothetical protein [Dyella nitratireducens]GGA34297.1 hypothetical protein GCM10010981_24110 [Dyella nitratireducens]GLQ40845.1 hypothetical protein GCM10007902_06950 [Dyella nitratireducens]
MVKSPRDAATWAVVYRRRTREKPRDYLLKLTGAIGALLVHLLVLLGSIFGSPYELPPPPPEPKGNMLFVRLIPNKPPPPPPPPVRGVPPKEHGPTHRGNTSQVVHATHEMSTAAPVAAVTQPPVPAPKQPPVAAQVKQPAAEKAQQQPAAPLPPITLPKPSPQQIEQPTPTGLPPPPLTLQAVQVPQPVPPQFQPEPARKPQPEGTQPMPPLPSLALPTQPAQSAPTITAPQMAVENPSLAPSPMPSVAPVQPSPPSAAPPAPALQPIPMPAQEAPTVNLQASATPLATPNVQRTAPQQLGPVVRPQEQPTLAPVPVTPVAAAPTPNVTPSAPALNIEAPKLAVPEVSLRPQLSPAPAPTPTTTQSETKPSTSPSSEKETAATSSPTPSPSPANAPANEGNASTSTAPNATPQGSETANPGQPNGVAQSPNENNGTQGTQPSSSTGNGNNTAGEQGGGTPGTPNGTYIQLKPRGDTEIMSHNTNLPGYKRTRFDQYWTPEGESSVDTALRHAVEKTTVKHTFNLPQGVRIECQVMPLLPSSLFGCHNPDPPAKPLDQKIYDRLNLPTQNASVPKTDVATAASAPAPTAPVVLDNSAECAAARVSGGPMPPNCPPDTSTPVKPLQPIKPVGALPSKSGSWVPASDQFH